MRIDYSRFYRGTTEIPSYGKGANKKDTLVKYEFNTRDEHGNKIMDKMTKEETLQAMKDIRAQYGDSVIVEFSGDGMAALAEHKKGGNFGSALPEQENRDEKDALFQQEIKHYDKSLNHLPAYSGLSGADKAVASAVEHLGKREQEFVYGIIRENFFVANSSSMTEEERQANISLGMKKAEYAAGSFISGEHRKSFLEAMESIAKLAGADTADSSGNMDYGIAKARYLGHGSNLIQTTNALDMMRTMDKDAYAEYQNIDISKDDGLSSLKFLTNWYAGAVEKNHSMVDDYEKQSEEYLEKNVKDRKLVLGISGIVDGTVMVLQVSAGRETDYQTYFGLYAIQSASWHISIFVSGAATFIFLTVMVIVKSIIHFIFFCLHAVIHSPYHFVLPGVSVINKRFHLYHRMRFADRYAKTEELHIIIKTLYDRKEE